MSLSSVVSEQSVIAGVPSCARIFALLQALGKLVTPGVDSANRFLVGASFGCAKSNITPRLERLHGALGDENAFSCGPR